MERVLEAAKLYEEDLPAPFASLRFELQTWARVTMESTETSLEPLVALAIDHLLPSIVTLLRLYGTFPVSVASAERSFSKLKLLCNDRRSTMAQDRLSSLALMTINAEMTAKVNVNNVINRFRDLPGKRKIIL